MIYEPRTDVYGWGDNGTLEMGFSDGISISPTNSACNLITDNCNQAIESSTMVRAVASLTVTDHSAAVNYVQYITTIAISRVQLIYMEAFDRS